MAVHDNGNGIPQNITEMIFQPFLQQNLQARVPV
jgi:nitrogen-specific signal transduction histidine kinase